MESLIEPYLHGAPLYALFLLIAAMLYVVGKGADILVEEAVTLSIRWNVPTTVIGATIVSLGTTTPETAVSVVAALKGSPDLALGNAVGSIICDTGLILGLAAIISPLPLHRSVVNRQGWIQVSSGLLLVFVSLPFSSMSGVFSLGGNLPRWAGFLFLGLLAVYILRSIWWARIPQEVLSSGLEEELPISRAGSGIVLLKLLLGVFLVVGSSTLLVPAVKETALRLSVPQSIIAATLVAFGTSLPELVTSVTAALKKQGELAVGNVIGADILNVLFVSGAAAAATPGGLQVPPNFFYLLFPTMLFVLAVFRIGIFFSGDTLKRSFGFVLLLSYALATVLGYLIK